MSAKARLRILEILANTGREMTGMDLAKTDPKTIRLGVVYVDLDRLQRTGDVTSRLQTPEELLKEFEAQTIPRSFPLPRRFYKITPGGRRKLIENSAQSNQGNFGLQGAS